MAVAFMRAAVPRTIVDGLLTRESPRVWRVKVLLFNGATEEKKGPRKHVVPCFALAKFCGDHQLPLPEDWRENPTITEELMDAR
jgi:hypothetical protein